MTKKKKDKKETNEFSTFTVPFALGTKENITITNNYPSKPSKEEFINKAIKFHLNGQV